MKLPWKPEIKISAKLMIAVLLMIVLSGNLVYSFNEYRSLIIKEQEEQLLTISQTISNSISLYTDFYFQDLKGMNIDREYLAAGKQYLDGGGTAPLEQFLDGHMEIQKEDVVSYMIGADTEACAEDSVDVQSGRASGYVSVKCFSGKEEGTRIDVLNDAEDNYYLGLSVPTLDGSRRLYCVIDIERMYQKVASYIRVGENGYVMIKDSTGRILMHPSKEQIGLNVIEGREELYPEFDLTELSEMISHQLQGIEGVESYHSYWWPQEVPERIRKIAAYTPAWFGDDFLIVSAVIDYDEIAGPIAQAMLTVSLLTIAIVTIFLLILYQLLVVSQARQRMERENAKLRELNAKLEELHKRQEQLYHDQRLQLIGTLTGGIAHEFNNLLTPIMGYSGLLMAESEEGSDIYESADEIYRAAQKAREIIGQIAALSRKHVDRAAKPVPVQKAAERVVKMLETIVPGNVRLTVRMDFGEDCCMLCSETSFNQIVLNLFTNACHAMRGMEGALELAGGSVSGAEAAKDFSAAEYAGAYARFSVKDNGEGMSEELLSHIFDPFFTTKQAGEGTGLGLSTVQSLLEAMGGGIVAESRPGEGSCFTFYLPLADDHASETGTSVPGRKRTAKGAGRVLLAEDDIRILRLFEKGLREAGFQVRAFNDPLEAAKALETGLYDVVVTDYAMPKLNGAQIARMAKSEGRDCRVILITGLVEETIQEYRQKKLIDAVLLKPLEVQTLVETIDQEIDKR